VKGDDLVEEYIESLNNMLCSDTKKIQLIEVVERWCGGVASSNASSITSEFSGGPQTVGWLSIKATAHKTKSETNQKNRLDELAKNRKTEEE
jgi:biopolymer transport protein ExbB/TolQ